MLNKKLVLGSLAGATLLVGAAIMLPTAAEASVVSGTCVNCHTMHNSQEGNTMGNALPQDYLLRYAGCAGCHAETNVNGAATGVATTGAHAPQVTDSTNFLSAGYFGGNNTRAHSVTDVGITWADAVNLATGPGGTFAQAAFVCTDCHGAATGGHHAVAYDASTTKNGTATAGDSYRFLNPNVAGGNYVAGTGLGNYSVAAAGTLSGMSTYTAVGQTGLNGFCAGCHGGFHGAANTNSDGTSTTTGSGPWVRHPTGVVTTAYAPQNYAGTDNMVPVSSANEVMCVSCHFAHGSSRTDLLRFDYAANQAGNAGPVEQGCETCHGLK